MTPLQIFNNKLLLSQFGSLALDSSCCCCDLTCMDDAGGTCIVNTVTYDPFSGFVDSCGYPSYTVSVTIFANEPNTTYSWNDGWPGSYSVGYNPPDYECLFFTRFSYTSRGSDTCSSYSTQCCFRIALVYKLWKIDCLNEQVIDITDEAVTFADIGGYTQISNGHFLRCTSTGAGGFSVIDCDCCTGVNLDNPDNTTQVTLNCAP